MARSPSKPPTDLTVIDNAPLEPSIDGDGELVDDLYSYVGYLTDSLAEAEAEIERLKGKASYDDVRASMLEPFANKVFGFVAIYCVSVLALLLASGFANSGFRLSDTILAIVAGSTAVSVIGLIGMVVSGLFGSRK